MSLKTPILEAVQNKITALLAVHKKLFIAYSGGMDSHVLLHLVAKSCLAKDLSRITAIHVNHNISSDSLAWSKHCEQVCKKLGVGYITKDVKLNSKDKSSIEEALRNLRYEVFAELMPKGACILTAHHADDQAETLLLQLFRGAGPKGLAAMPESTKFAKGYLVRPFVNTLRSEMQQYAKKFKLKWIEDKSNADTKFDRNFIRHRLSPLIQKRWPSGAATLNRVSRNCAEASELLDILAEQDLQLVLSEDKKSLSAASLKKLTLVRQKNVLRYWFFTLELPTPSEAKLGEVIRSVMNSRYDGVPVVSWVGAEVRRFRDHIYAMPPLTKHNNKEVLRFSSKTLTLPSNIGVLKVKIPKDSDLELDKLQVCFRKSGEKIKMPHRRCTQDLKKLMQEWDIPPWFRDRVPLIYYNDKIIAVVGYYNSDLCEFNLDP